MVTYFAKLFKAFKNHPNLHFYRFGSVATEGGPLNRVPPVKYGRKFWHWDSWLSIERGDQKKLLTFSGLGFIFAKVLSEFFMKYQKEKKRVIGVMQTGYSMH